MSTILTGEHYVAQTKDEMKWEIRNISDGELVRTVEGTTALAQDVLMCLDHAVEQGH